MNRIHRRTALEAFAAMACGMALPAVPALGQEQPKKARRDPYADAVLVDGEPPKPEPGSFSIAVLPDTQNYSEKYPEIFEAQTNWIVEQKEKRKIAFVLQLGDITNRNSTAEWENARRAIKRLDGVAPAFLALGNHDYSAGGVCKDRSTLFNEFFPVASAKPQPTFGGVYDREPERMENSFHLASAGERQFLVLSLEFGPRNDVIRWANEVVKSHSEREVILITHAFIYFDDTRYNWKKFGAKQSWNPHSYGVAKATRDDVNDGEELWTKLISRHENFVMTLNGHVLGDGLGRFESSTPKGRTVPQILVNYQMRPNGGDGWLRLLEFKADGVTVDACDYSPTRKQRNESKQSRFRFKVAKVG